MGYIGISHRKKKRQFSLLSAFLEVVFLKPTFPPSAKEIRTTSEEVEIWAAPWHVADIPELVASLIAPINKAYDAMRLILTQLYFLSPRRPMGVTGGLKAGEAGG